MPKIYLHNTYISSIKAHRIFPVLEVSLPLAPDLDVGLPVIWIILYNYREYACFSFQFSIWSFTSPWHIKIILIGLTDPSLTVGRYDLLMMMGDGGRGCCCFQILKQPHRNRSIHLRAVTPQTGTYTHRHRRSTYNIFLFTSGLKRSATPYVYF